MVNAFSAMLKRKRATLAQVRQAWNAYEQIPLRLVEVETEQVLRIASQYDIYAYDAYFIVCALQQKSALLTLDGGLRQAAIQAGVKIVEVTA